MDYILYHANCQDGWVAAYIAKKKYPKAGLIPLHYGISRKDLDDVFNQVRGKRVLMVDYCFASLELNEELEREAGLLRIFDHHVSKAYILRELGCAVYDPARSGAGLTWDYLFGRNSGHDFPRPWWVNYTEDQDLWSWKLRYSREINSYLMVQERTIGRWKQIETITDEMSVFDQGIGTLARTKFDVRDLMRNVQTGLFHGYRTGVINTPIVVSEIGEAIYNAGFDIALAWHERVQGDISFGLRSTKIDVGEIAKSYGGGGHKSAAGFEVSIEKGREIIDTVLGRKEKYEHTSRCC